MQPVTLAVFLTAMALSVTRADAVPLESRIVNGTPGTGAANSKVSLQMEWCSWRDSWLLCSTIPMPYQSSARRGYSHLCTGTLVAEDFVLTAGHCCQPMLDAPKGRYRVVAGVTALADPQGMKQFLNIRGIYNHPQYNGDTLDFDVCLIRLASPMVSAETAGRTEIAKISSDAPGTQYDGVKISVAGWGKTGTTSSPSPVLNLANVMGVSNSYCKSFYGAVITPRTLCTDSGVQAVCSGDSGGPVVVHDAAKGEDFLVGVVSFGSGVGCGSGNPDGHQGISYHLPWVCGIVSRYRSISLCTGAARNKIYL